MKVDKQSTASGAYGIKRWGKLEKDIIEKNGKKTVTTVSFPFFYVLIVKNTQKMYFEIVKYIKL